jgi:pimeloyl-ACP methyl ester carboxylesterase
MRWILGFCVALCAGGAFAQLPALQPLGPGKSDAQAIVLVSGINNTWRWFEPWFPELQGREAALYGFTGDHRAHTMTQNARALADGLAQLQAQGVRKITLLAHSMGGLVAKKALHLLAEQGRLQQFESVAFTAYGTPWGGSGWAMLARLPGSSLVIKALALPMAREMDPRSDFMASLRQPLPANVRFEIMESEADDVALPRARAAVAQYRAILAQANIVERVAAVDHDGFARRLKPFL